MRWPHEALADRSVSRESLNHLTCIAFLSATDASIEAVKQELAKPRYGGYWLCKLSRSAGGIKLITDFSNTLSKRQIEEMATVDEFEVVKEIQVSR